METFSPTCRFRGPVIPNWIIGNNRLCSGAKLLYVVLAANACGRDHCWPSQSTLAKKMCVSLRSVQKYLHELEVEGFIHIERIKDGTVLRYYFLKNSSVELMPLPTADVPARGNDSHAAPTYPLSASVDGYAKFAGGVANPLQANLVSPPRSSADPKNDRGSVLPAPLAASIASPGECANPVQGCAKIAGGYANSADNINYNINININTNPPLPPQAESQVALSSLGVNRVEGGASALESCEKAFSRLFDAWPRKEAKHAALKTWKSLWFSAQLPPFEEILRKIEALKKNDRAWLRGYAPYLVNWLRNESWRDALIEPPSAPFPAPSEGSSSSTAVKSSKPDTHENEVKFEHFQQLFRKAFPSARTGQQPEKGQELYIRQLQEKYLLGNHQRPVC